MEMLGRSMMLASISEEQLLVDDHLNSISSHRFGMGLQPSARIKTGLSELAKAPAQTYCHFQEAAASQQPSSQQSTNDDCWGFFLDDE